MSDDSPLVVGVDCSTTAAKAIAWDAAGGACAEGRAPIRLDHPASDGWEQDAEQWWTATVTALRSMSDGLGDDAARVRGLTVTHQRETVVVTDPEGVPLHPALVWMDARCRPHVARAVEVLGAERLHTVSGKPPCTTPSVYKLLFLFEHAKSLAGRDLRVLDVHAFVVRHLTGKFVTSVASADPTGLVDMKQRDWSDEVLHFAGLDRGHLPALAEPGALIGTLTDDVARATGLRPGLPVFAGAGDGQAAGLGAGIDAPGRAYLNLGTAVVSGVLSHRYVTDRAFRTMTGAAPGTYFLETDLKGGTFTLTWLVETMLGGDPARTGETLDRLGDDAAGLPPGSDGLVLVPYWNGVMNPYWDDDATGVAIGWRGEHGPAHLYRAALEGIAFEQRLHTEGVEGATGSRIDELVVMGGGAKSELWCRILADVLGRRVTRAGSEEATSLGAAILAAVGAGVHPDLMTATKHMTRTADSFEPERDQERYDVLFREVYEGLFGDVRERLRRLASLTRRADA